MKLLIIIPARGQSKGIPRKNVKFLHGKPLLSYAIQNAKSINLDKDIFVSTEDLEIASVSSLYNVKVINRSKNLSEDHVTLDAVIYEALIKAESITQSKYDYVISLQPTSPLLKAATLNSAIEYAISNNLDTLISVYNNPHLSWGKTNSKFQPNYSTRVNRQELPGNYVETGAFLITKRRFVSSNSRIGADVNVYELDSREAIDIDTYHDWVIAETELNRKRIIIRVDGYKEIGLGHIYRCLAIADKLIKHDFKFVLSKKSDIGEKIIKNSFYYYHVIDDKSLDNLIETYRPHIWINDILDTTKPYMENLKKYDLRVINFEDLGQGALIADAVINDLYEKKHNGGNHYWGKDYYVLRDEFLLYKTKRFEDKVKEVLIVFGGTDPSRLTLKVSELIHAFTDIHFTFILGKGFKEKKSLLDNLEKHEINYDIFEDVKNISEFMANADLAISSQGRTMYELASQLTPTILLAQNSRELHHEFGYIQNGFINLGLGSDTDAQTIINTLNWLIQTPQIRLELRKQMLKLNLEQGIHRVMDIIL